MINPIACVFFYIFGKKRLRVKKMSIFFIYKLRVLKCEKIHNSFMNVKRKKQRHKMTEGRMMVEAPASEKEAVKGVWLCCL